MGNGGVAPRILNLGRFTPREELPVPIGYEDGLAREPVWTRWQREKYICSCRKSNPGRPARSLVTELAELIDVSQTYGQTYR
jgi:hypothetical protein